MGMGMGLSSFPVEDMPSPNPSRKREGDFPVAPDTSQCYSHS
jgi:hypothetical protein